MFLEKNQVVLFSNLEPYRGQQSQYNSTVVDTTTGC